MISSENSVSKPASLIKQIFYKGHALVNAAVPLAGL